MAKPAAVTPKDQPKVLRTTGYPISLIEIPRALEPPNGGPLQVVNEARFTRR
ncbi:hypothetical protein MTQ01_08795 [Streptomyces sp. XM4193]|uniref:hypothetical protein n=1 Tax=Streptomyces sp. XM4193 TaxID=2929782 RepID=UPI001FF7ADAA|nr:hypothetical protein [Streptomyces sp. XM4193]MCK1796100.1 hypothetical protein [Streptomyces sp. XM4193]